MMAGWQAAFFILVRRKSWEKIDFFSWKNNNNCKARGCIFLSGYEEGSTSKVLLLFTLLQHYYYVFSSVKSWIRKFPGVCSEKIPKAVLIVSAKVGKKHHNFQSETISVFEKIIHEKSHILPSSQNAAAPLLT